MSTPTLAPPQAGAERISLYLLLAGLAALYVPAVMHLWNTLWQTEDQSHAPLIMAAALWLFYEKRHVFLAAPDAPRPAQGIVLVLVGVLLYFLGTTQSIVLFQLGSMMPVVIGGVAAVYGWSAVRQLAFPIFFLFFAAPLPGFIVDAITAPMKIMISVATEHFLYALGYPIARSGVVLSIGPYQLLVADACSGMNSLVSLIAIGFFYVYISGKRSLGHKAVLILSTPFIAILANFLRVVALSLITYHFGDEAGQGFMHGATGVFLFGVALVLLFMLDFVLTRLMDRQRAQPTGADPS